MPIELGVRVYNSRLSTHEGLRVACRLINKGEPPLEIPSGYDRSGSFHLELRNGGSQPFRVMNRQTRQVAMTEGRVDASLDLDTLKPGQTWTWYMDMASYHYPIPPGNYDLAAVYEYDPARLRLATQPIAVEVRPAAVRSVSVLRDNPILDGLAMLIEAEEGGVSQYYLRLCNYARPVGAWWSIPVCAGEFEVKPFCASANFYQTESTDLFHRRWVIWAEKGRLVARCVDRGEIVSPDRTAALPAGRDLVRSAIRTVDDQLYIFCRSGELLECYRFGDELIKVFDQSISARARLAIGGDDSAIHITAQDRRLTYYRLNLSGQLQEQVELFRGRGPAVSVAFEPSENRIKALYGDSERGKSLQMVLVDLNHDLVVQDSEDRLPVRDRVVEASFDVDAAGRFHLLYSTGTGKLYYESEGRGPVLVAAGERRYCPVVVAPQSVFLGCYQSAMGYRFLQYQRRRQGSKIVGREERP